MRRGRDHQAAHQRATALRGQKHDIRSQGRKSGRGAFTDPAWAGAPVISATRERASSDLSRRSVGSKQAGLSRISSAVLCQMKGLGVVVQVAGQDPTGLFDLVQPGRLLWGQAAAQWAEQRNYRR